MNAIDQAIERIAEGTSLRIQADAENASKDAEIMALWKLIARVSVAFRCDLSQPEANDYYWSTRQDVEDVLEAVKA